MLLLCIGEDPDREGLRDTPRRFADFWREFMEYNPGNTDTTFEVVKTDQLVVVAGIRVWSLCEHHLLPYWCDVSIGYLTESRVLGLSKLARIAHEAAHRLTLQESLISDIGRRVSERAETQSVAVLGRGEHTCMVMRGIKTPAIMVSSVMHGRFRDAPELRAEFMEAVKHGQR